MDGIVVARAAIGDAVAGLVPPRVLWFVVARPGGTNRGTGQPITTRDRGALSPDDVLIVRGAATFALVVGVMTLVTSVGHAVQGREAEPLLAAAGW